MKNTIPRSRISDNSQCILVVEFRFGNFSMGGIVIVKCFNKIKYEGVHQVRWNFTHMSINVLTCHFKRLIEILMSSSLNINDWWHTVNPSQKMAFFGYKIITRSRIGLEIGRMANFWVENSKMTTIFEIDEFLITYS